MNQFSQTFLLVFYECTGCSGPDSSTCLLFFAGQVKIDVLQIKNMVRKPVYIYNYIYNIYIYIYIYIYYIENIGWSQICDRAGCGQQAQAQKSTENRARSTANIQLAVLTCSKRSGCLGLREWMAKVGLRAFLAAHRRSPGGGCG